MLSSRKQQQMCSQRESTASHWVAFSYFVPRHKKEYGQLKCAVPNVLRHSDILIHATYN
jgi:hypothetical protein